MSPEQHFAPPGGVSRQGVKSPPAGVARVFDGDRDGVPIPVISPQARAFVWSGVGAEIATMNFVVLEPGEENQPHTHAASDDTIAILEGRGTVRDLSAGTSRPFEAGDVVHVPAGVPHQVRADRGEVVVRLPLPARRGPPAGVRPAQRTAAASR